MADGNATIEIVIEETGEILPLRIGSLVNDVRSIMLDWLRAQGDAWAKMSEADQKDAIIRAENMAGDLIKKMAGIVAQGRFDVVHASLEQFAVKDGVVKIVGKGIADDRAILKLNQVGNKALKIVVADEGQFDEEQPRKEKADPDQPDLIPEEEPEAPDNVTQLHDRSMVPDKKKKADAETAKEGQAKLSVVGDDTTSPNDEMTGDEVDQIAADMDDDLEKADDDDGALQAAITDAQTEKPDEADPADLGFTAMIDGNARDANPYDETSDNGTRWLLGWDQAKQQSDDLILSGQTDASMGKDRMVQDDEVSQRFYDQGYNGEVTIEQ